MAIAYAIFARIFKHPEQAIKLFLRFAIAKGIVVYGMELMMTIFDIDKELYLLL